MSKFATKVAAGILTATTVVSLSGFGSFAGVASAQTMDVATLLAQIQALQAQLLALQGGGSMAMTSSCGFTRDLTVGARGTDVTCLQNALIAAGHLGAGYNTGYFGALTKAAVMKWQAAAGVTPVAGYFGPKSRAAFAAAMPATPTTPTTPTTPNPVVNPTTSLWVAAAAGSPTGSAIAGAGQINVGRFSFTAPATMGVTVSGMTFQKVGVVSDSNISNLYLADVATGAVVAQFQSLTSGVATFSGLALNVAAGQTWWGELRADISTSATSGNTLAFDLSGVTTVGNVSVAGLPVKGNLLTVTSVSNPAIATLSLTANAVGSTIDAGTNSVLVSSWTANVTNSAVNLRNLQFSFVGSANPGDIRNLRLMINGTQVATLPTAANETVFSIAGSPIQLKTGQSTIEIFADVAGSPNRTFTFSLLQPYKVNAVDTQYGAGITASITSTNQTTITINTGSVTVQVASDSPSQPVPGGASAVTVAKFTIYAAGEPVKVKFLDGMFTVDDTDYATAAGVTDDLSNVRLIDDVGGQIGNSISTIADGAASGQCTLATSSATCHFGSSSSPINYIVPANTTRVISLVADIGSSANIGTISGSLPSMTSNLEGQTSYQAASSGTASGATRQVNTTPLTVAANATLVAPTYIAGSTQAKIASFVLTASSAQAARVSSLTFDKDTSTSFDMQNMVVKVGSTQFGTTRSTIGDSETSLAFSNSNPIVVNAGSSVTVDVFADILTTTGSGPAISHPSVIDLTGWSAIGATSGSSISFPGAATGQSIAISTGPALGLTLGSSVAARYMVMGSTGNTLVNFSFTNDNVDDIRITDITVSDTISSGSDGVASFQNLEIYDGSTKLAGPLSMTSAGSGASGTVAFSLTNPLVIAKNASKSVTLKGDVATFSSGGAVSNSSHIFKINANGDLIVKSVGSPTATVTVSGAPITGNSHTVYRTNLSLSSAVMGAASNRTRKANDDVAKMTFGADSAYKAVVGTVTLKFTGAAVTSGGTAFAVDLIDDATGSAWKSTSSVNCTPGQGNSCSVTFNPTSAEVAAGGTEVVRVRVNSASFTNGASATDALSISVQSAGDLRWNDGTTSNISFESRLAPFTVADVSYE